MAEAPPDVIRAKPGTDVLFHQDFVKLEEALQCQSWEVDGDDARIFVCEEGDGEGPAGTVLVLEGGTEARVELTHWLGGGEGACVTHFSASFIIMSLDPEAADSGFSFGVSWNEDLVDSSLASLTVRGPKNHAGDSDSGDSEPARDVPVSLDMYLNGDVVASDLGTMPLKFQVQFDLCWENRTVELNFTTSSLHVENFVAGSMRTGSAKTGFYTTSSECKRAAALCFSCNGTITVRLLSTECAGRHGTKETIPN
uniref:Uncharacterized protein n=1 Tax=Noctiluca scintillans TaxID=2966 RepID=A0A7S1FA06_NOCSC